MLRPLVIVLLAMGVVACGQQVPPAAPPAPTVSAPPPASATPAGGFGVTEQAFVQLAIATDDQAVKLLELGATTATEPLLRDLAKNLTEARRTELTALHALLTEASVQYQNLHAGHDMPGMPTEDELSTLRASPAFDTEFARLARAHLTESRTVAHSAAENVTHAGTKSVAATMVADRDAELATLDGLG
ncbi:DUF305 domain-containing protein [Actinophytocola sediminis]